MTIAEAFGFSWESQKEPWHLRHFLGDEVSFAVLQVEAFIASMS